MKVGILGSGGVGQSLGTGLAAKGHDVKIGTRNPEKAALKKWLKSTKGKATVGTLAEAAAHGDVLVLCTAGVAAEEAIDAAGPKNFEGKLLIDVTNPLDFSKGLPPGLFVGLTDSLGERVQRKLPDAKVVKALNTVNQTTMIHPKMKDGLPDMLIAGDDKAAKRQVAKILKELGWGAPIDVGGIDGARWLEAWVPLWLRIANEFGSWSVALKILVK